jgi:hypothetical protein
VAFVAIGATVVGSINWTVKPGDVLAKGDELGECMARAACFAAGGALRRAALFGALARRRMPRCTRTPCRSRDPSRPAGGRWPAGRGKGAGWLPATPTAPPLPAACRLLCFWRQVGCFAGGRRTAWRRPLAPESLASGAALTHGLSPLTVAAHVPPRFLLPACLPAVPTSL